MNAGNRANGALLAGIRRKTVFRQARSTVHNGVLVFIFTVLCDGESWVWRKKNESKINAMELKSLNHMCDGVILEDKCENIDRRERWGLTEKGCMNGYSQVDTTNDWRSMKETYKANL
ncbi:hypothetical protein EVAR_41212_1 [Eumeta japonica]|uniref:Uncharacterized protein n=1 Tax=Eumeta variegata TaxID=151549 RepID=A0A4C1W4D2_EUMVA|nr:hypothetical protein EVAR_41212_1 [Eumeta japonica]